MNPGLGAPNSNVFAAAVQWFGGAITGTLATTIAIIAVASLGLLMLAGRVDRRRSTQVILGCFIIFGASSIAAGIMRVLSGSAVAIETTPPDLPAAAYPRAAAQAVPATGAYDPYAGAAMPTR